MTRRRDLSPEDRKLWSQVARSVVPLHPVSRKIPTADTGNHSSGPKAPKVRPPQDFTLPSDLVIGGHRDTYYRGMNRYDPAPTPAETLHAQPVRMDHKTHRKMTGGKLRPEARLDLHGMTLSEAGPELMQFILSCHANGLRLVLVITGKGSRAAEDAPLPVRTGALRHQVPHWLHCPPLVQVIQQVTPAHLRHGGTGAYYVYLRRS